MDYNYELNNLNYKTSYKKLANIETSVVSKSRNNLLVLILKMKIKL